MAHFLVVVIAIFLDRIFGEPETYHPLKGFTFLALHLEDQWHRKRNGNAHLMAGRQSTSAPGTAGTGGQVVQFGASGPILESGQKPSSAQVSASGQVQEAAQVPNFTQATTRADSSSEQGEAPKALPDKAYERAVKLSGMTAVAALVLPFVFLVSVFGQSSPQISFILDICVLYFSLGMSHLKEHALETENALIAEDLEAARLGLSTMVNCDTKQMDKQAIISTCIESIVENACEVIAAPIFWYLAFGASGVILCSLTHVLSVLWGYQNEHYTNFGWFARRANNVLNWIPSRLTALSYMILGNMKNTWYCFNAQARNINSPNAELLIATGAGALDLEIGGDLYYFGERKERPNFGHGRMPVLSDIPRACDLMERSIVLWLALVFVVCIGH